MNHTQSPLSLAVSRAIAEAELRRMEMSRSLRPEQVARLLESQAKASATSPLAYDQLLALALRASAQVGEPDRASLDALRSPADPTARHRIAREALAKFEDRSFAPAIEAAPDWELHRASRRVGKAPRAQAAWLRAAAELSRHLWDHPALPAEPAFRGAMLACVTALRQRADAIAATAPLRGPGRPRRLTLRSLETLMAGEDHPP
ncbi:MAG TPA: hypothetical protein VFN88_07480 [Caulobacteraceae bacterium]|nr:hypothetical protein [Caulobacteraceae bacterium]